MRVTFHVVSHLPETKNILRKLFINHHELSVPEIIKVLNLLNLISSPLEIRALPYTFKPLHTFRLIECRCYSDRKLTKSSFYSVVPSSCSFPIILENNNKVENTLFQMQHPPSEMAKFASSCVRGNE